MTRPEETIQRAIVAYLRLALPTTAVVWATPNQRGTRSRWEMGLLAALGVRAGVPDLFVLHAGHLIGLEVKAPMGRVSKAQEATGAMLRLAGASVFVVRSVEEAAQALTDADIPLTARITA